MRAKLSISREELGDDAQESEDDTSFLRIEQVFSFFISFPSMVCEAKAVLQTGEEIISHMSVLRNF